MSSGPGLPLFETRRRIVGSLFWIGVAVLVLNLWAVHVSQAQDVLPRLPEKQGIARSDPAQPSKAKEQPKPKQSNAQNPAGPPVRPSAGGKSQNNTTSSTPEANKPDRYKKADLDAQRRMAVAAENLIYFTKIEIGLLAVGSTGLFITIIYSVRSYRLSAKTAERQLRAYVHVMKLSIKFPEEGQIEIVVNAKNFGSTPAYKFRHNSRIGQTPSAQTTTEIVQTPIMAALGPTAQFTMPVARHVSPEAWNNIKAATIPLYCWGRVDYVDAFNRDQWITYQFQFEANSNSMVASPEGNDTS